MCPHGYHHSGSMATPALGTRDVRFILLEKLKQQNLFGKWTETLDFAAHFAHNW